MSAEGVVIVSGEKISSVQVGDMAGRVTVSRDVDDTATVISVDSLSSGVYVLSVKYGDGTCESMKFALSK